MSLQSNFDEICDSVINGQIKQAARLANQLDSDEKCQCIDYIYNELDNLPLAIDVAKTMIRYN